MHGGEGGEIRATGIGMQLHGRQVSAELLAGKPSVAYTGAALLKMILPKPWGSCSVLAVGTSPPLLLGKRSLVLLPALLLLMARPFHPDFICLAAWKAPIQLVHEMGCSSSISAPFLICLITFDLDKIPLPPQEGQMTLCVALAVSPRAQHLQAVHCTYPQCGR